MQMIPVGLAQRRQAWWCRRAPGRCQVSRLTM